MFQTYSHIIKCQIQNCKNVLEMVCVHRSGSSVSIPRRLSHHVPVVPIINWDPAEMERRETAEYQVLYCTVLYFTVLYSILYQDTDSDQLQLYKSASVEQYELVAVDKVSDITRASNDPSGPNQ